jgi:calcineurin-like phosphoesterase family protein
MTYWFTSDYHLGHENIIKYCNRPFKSLEEMNTTIIKNHNSRVKKEDTVFHIGDFCFKNTSDRGEGIRKYYWEWEQELNGKIIHIKGNHDKNNSTKTIIEQAVINYGGNFIKLVHKPDHVEIKYKYNFVGHIHDKWKFKIMNKVGSNKKVYVVNVGVDVHNYYPVNIDQIREIFKIEGDVIFKDSTKYKNLTKEHNREHV